MTYRPAFQGTSHEDSSVRRHDGSPRSNVTSSNAELKTISMNESQARRASLAMLLLVLICFVLPFFNIIDFTSHKGTCQGGPFFLGQSCYGDPSMDTTRSLLGAAFIAVLVALVLGVLKVRFRAALVAACLLYTSRCV